VSSRRVSFFVNTSEVPGEELISDALGAAVQAYDANTDPSRERSRVSFTLPSGLDLDTAAVEAALNAAVPSGIAALEEVRV
jgi:hypothetical protein